jgi:hypothetical protein
VKARALLAVCGTAIVLLAAAPTFAQSAPAPGQIINAVLDTRAATEPLDRELDNAARRGTLWVGYQVPSTGAQHQTCVPYAADGVARVMLEKPREISILIRFEANAVSRIRVSTPECVIDAGGLPVIWLQNIKPAESVAWLVKTINQTPTLRDNRDRGFEGALSALSLHAGDDATRALLALAKNDARKDVRGRALFWLAQRASSADAVAAIRNAVENDPELEVKRKAVFALSQLPPDQGVPLLIEVARNHRDREVRRQAMTWLGQSNDPRAVRFFEEVLAKK